MPQQDEDLSFLSFFLTEPIYLLPEVPPAEVPPAESSSAETSPAEEPEPTFSDRTATAEPLVPSESRQEEATLQSEDSPGEAAVSTSPQPPTFQGENRKKVLVLFYQPDDEYMTEAASSFLEKILKAVAHDLDDVARCNWALLERQEPAWPDVYESLQMVDCQKILAFGDLPLAWSKSHFFQKYHITEDAAQRRLLQADNLHEIAQNRDLKVKLWESLQQLFK